LTSRTKTDFQSSTLSENHLADLQTSLELSSRKGYVDGEENVKDCEDSDFHNSKIIHHKFQNGTF